MLPIRQIIDDAPEYISIPEELRHRRIELIIWPLTEEIPALTVTPTSAQSAVTERKPQPSFYDLTQEFCGCIKDGPLDLSTNPNYMEGFGE
jgi:hypothetical protein